MENDEQNPNEQSTEETVKAATPENPPKEETPQEEPPKQEIPRIILQLPAGKKRGTQPGASRGPYNKRKTDNIEEATLVNDEHTQKHNQFKNEAEAERVKYEQGQEPPPNQLPPPPKPEPEPIETETEEVEEEPKYDTDLFNGLFLLKIFDMLFPLVLKGVLSVFNKKAKKLKLANLKLDEDEKEDFEPIADQVAPIIFSKIPPLWLSGMLILYTYSRKISYELGKIPDEEEKK